MCLALLLDTLVIAVLAKLFSGDNDEGFVKPLVLAIGASATSAAIGTLANAYPDYALWILLAIAVGVSFFVALGCWLLLNVPVGKSFLVGAIFVAYKVLFVVLYVLLFMAGG